MTKAIFSLLHCKHLDNRVFPLQIESNYRPMLKLHVLHEQYHMGYIVVTPTPLTTRPCQGVLHQTLCFGRIVLLRLNLQSPFQRLSDVIYRCSWYKLLSQNPRRFQHGTIRCPCSYSQILSFYPRQPLRPTQSIVNRL